MSNSRRATSAWHYSSPNKHETQDRRRSAPLTKTSVPKSSSGRAFSPLFAPLSEGSDGGRESFSPPQTPPGSVRRNKIAPPNLTRTAGRASRESSINTPDRRLSHTLVGESPPADHDLANMSGVTLPGGDSDAEPQEPDPSQLSSLLDVSNKVLASLTAENISYKGILDAFRNTPFKTRLGKLKEKLKEQKSSITHKHLVPVPENTPPSLKPILQKANLAQFAMDIIRPAPESYTGEQVRHVDYEFPGAFMGSVPPELVQETFDLGLEIRTQRLIISLERLASHHERGGPEAMLEGIFYSLSIGNDRELRGWVADGLEDDMGALPEEFHEKVQSRIGSIRAEFGDDTSNPVDIDGLYGKFRWEDFIIRVATWIRERVASVDKELVVQNSLQSAGESLRGKSGMVSRTGNQGAATASPTKQKKPLFARWDGGSKQPVNLGDCQTSPAKATKAADIPAPKKIFRSKAAIRHLQEREKRKSDQQTYSPQNEGTEENRAPSPVTDPGEGPSRRSETAADIVRLAMTGIQRMPSSKQQPSSAADIFKSAQTGHQILKSKATSVSSSRAYIDRQDNASRVSSIESTPASARQPAPRGGKRKRKAVASESDDSDFEPNERPDKQLRGELQSFTRRARAEPEEEEVSGTFTRDRPPSLHSSDRGFETDQRPVISRQGAVPRPPSAHLRAHGAPAAVSGLPASILNLVSESDSNSPMEKTIEDSRSSIRNRAPSRGRKRWTDDEVEALASYINKHGSRYSHIKKIDSESRQILLGRSQVNLKDKARDLAFALWKYHRDVDAMPHNFVFVRLRQTQIKILEDMGIKLPEELTEAQRRS